MAFETPGPLWRVRLLFESQDCPETHEMPARKMVMKNTYKGIKHITSADKILVTEAFARWQQNRARPNTDDIKILFSKYHEYVYKSPKDMGCPSCVQYIYDYWQKTVTTWHQAAHS